jgi:hypothetical protein
MSVIRSELDEHHRTEYHDLIKGKETTDGWKLDLTPPAGTDYWRLDRASIFWLDPSFATTSVPPAAVVDTLSLKIHWATQTCADDNYV